MQVRGQQYIRNKSIFLCKICCPSLWWAGPGGQVKFAELFCTLFLGTLAPWNLGTFAPWYLSYLAPWHLGYLATWNLGILAPWNLGTLTLSVGSVFDQMPNFGEFWLRMKDFTEMKIAIKIVTTITDIFIYPYHENSDPYFDGNCNPYYHKKVQKLFQNVTSFRVPVQHDAHIESEFGKIKERTNWWTKIHKKKN